MKFSREFDSASRQPIGAEMLLPDRAQGVVLCLAAAATAVGLAILFNWQIRSAILAGLSPQAAAVQPLGALVLVLSGIALAAAAVKWRLLLYASAGAAVFICVMTLIEHATGRDFTANVWLFPDALRLQRPSPAHLGRVGTTSSLLFICLCASLVLSTLPSRLCRLWSGGLATMVLVFATLPLSEDIILHVISFSVFTRIFGVTFLGVAGGVFVGTGVLILTRDVGWPRLLAGDDEQGRLIRMTLPIALIPSVAAFAANLGVNAGLYNANIRLLLITDLSSATLLVLLFWVGQRLGSERMQREELSSALELSAVFVRSREGRIEHWPLGCEVLYGFTAAEAVGRLSHEMLQTEFPVPPAEIEAALERDGEWRGDVRHISRRGEVRWVAAQWVMQKRTSEASARVVEIANDITDLKQKDDALRDSEDRLTQALATYNLGILDYNLKTDKAVFSLELEQIAGLAHGALGDDVENWFALKPLKDRARTYSEVAADAKSRKPQSPLAVKIRRSDGELRELHGMRRYVYDKDGDLERVIGIYMDVTEQVRDRAELTARDARLRELQSELTHVSRLSAMGEMGAALAHELNQPLTAIGNSVGAIGMMLERDGPLEPPARERILRAARHTEGQAVRAGEIVRRLREFIARGEADSRAENLASLIVDAVALAIPTPLATNVEVRERFSPKVQEVLADRIQIQQVMVNLIRNALEAMRQQATPRILTISTAIKGSMAEVCVYDNGPGVSPEVAERLFSPFVSTKSNGMGVGLSICLRIVEAHGGKMWAARSPGGGAAFHFTLPLIRIEARHGPQTARASG